MSRVQVSCGQRCLERITDYVDYFQLVSQSEPYVNLLHTDHIAVVILSSSLLCNVALDTQEDDHAVFH